MKISNDQVLLRKQLFYEIIHKSFIWTREDQRYFRGVVMQSLTADFGLTFQSGKIESIEIEKRFVRAKDQEALDDLGQ